MRCLGAIAVVTVLLGTQVHAASKYYKRSQTAASGATISALPIAAGPVVLSPSTVSSSSNVIYSQPSVANIVVNPSNIVVPGALSLTPANVVYWTASQPSTTGANAPSGANKATTPKSQASLANTSCEQDEKIKKKIDDQLDKIEKLLKKAPCWEQKIYWMCEPN